METRLIYQIEHIYNLPLKSVEILGLVILGNNFSIYPRKWRKKPIFITLYINAQYITDGEMSVCTVRPLKLY